jgi:hypothetical protein
MTAAATASRPARHGGDHRGSAADRRARKNWMLATWGDGVKCPCVHCKAMLDFEAVEADRIIPGGPYARHNVQPSCRACNLARSDDASWTRELASA